MKTFFAIFISLVASLSAQEKWEILPEERSQEEKSLVEKTLRITEIFSDIKKTGREVSEDEAKLFEELYRQDGESKAAIDAKSYAFASLVRTRDVSYWSGELPILLDGESSQLAGSAIDAIYFVFKNGKSQDKGYLSNNLNIYELIDSAEEKFKDKNFSRKINKIRQELATFEESPERSGRTNSSDPPSKINPIQIGLDTRNPESEGQEESKFNIIWIFLLCLMVGIFFFFNKEKKK
ncbi:MAG: hypothetical protein ABF334_10950 [Akkermansiaceae bacterium]